MLLVIGITKITIWNYLGVKLILDSGSHLANLLTRHNGYVLIGKGLPPPPWTLKNYKPFVIDPADSNYWKR